jgi:hypothetical protein
MMAMVEGAGGWSQWVVEGLQQLGKQHAVPTFVSWDAQAMGFFNASSHETIVARSWGITDIHMVEGHSLGAGVVSSSWKGHTHEHRRSWRGAVRSWGRVFKSKVQCFLDDPELQRLVGLTLLALLAFMVVELLAFLVVFTVGSVGFMRVSTSCSVLIPSCRLPLIR